MQAIIMLSKYILATLFTETVRGNRSAVEDVAFEAD